MEEVTVIYNCQACGKEFKPCEFKMTLNPIEADSDEYYPRECPIESGNEPAFRRISPPRNHNPSCTEHETYHCMSCGWEGATTNNGACPECEGRDVR